MTDQNASVVPAAETPVKKRRGLGIASLVLALLAVIGDIIVIALAFGSISTFEDSVAGGLGLLAVFLGIGGVALVVGLVLAGIALILAIIALIVGSGRAPAVFGLILSLGVIVSHVAVIAVIASAGAAIGNLGG